MMPTGRSKHHRSRLAVAVGLLIVLAASTGSASAEATSNKFSLSTASPAAGSTSSGKLVWEVGYTGATPQKVDFYVDGALKWTEFYAPFRFNGDNGSLDASTLSAGSHLLKAVGYRSDYRTRTKITVHVPQASSSTTSSAPTSTSSPTISRASIVANGLAASTGSWSGTVPIGYAYEWLRCSSASDQSSCSTISGATSSSYTVDSGDAATYLRIRVAASNVAGSAAALSSATPQVAQAPTGSGFIPRQVWLKAPWNADAATVGVDPNSGALISTWIARGNIKYPNVCTNSWSVAWNSGSATDPKYDVAQTTWPGPLDGQIPIPRGTQPSPDADHHLVIFDLARNRVDELWAAAYNTTADTWSAGAGVSFDIGGTPPPGTGSNAAGLPQLALAVWPEEIQAGVINHALAYSRPLIVSGIRRRRRTARATRTTCPRARGSRSRAH
jgi:hypothetical protein